MKPALLRTLLIPLLVAGGSLRAEESSSSKEPVITAEQRSHWAYQPLRRPAVPRVKNTAWPRNAIDQFILARLEKGGLQPARAADRRTLIRRVSFDLIGLPPTPAEVDAFVNDPAPDAYERLVDRLLASPGYGERWAQHWLDLARYAETDGFEHDKTRKHAWKYRDWVIAALNRDLPYDEFVKRQLAADQLYPNDDRARQALGFLLNGPDMPDINLQSERRHAFLNEATGTVGSVFLGLQFGCAQCHDHKYDAISQRDFYRLRAFLDPYYRFTRFRTVALNGPRGTQTVSHLMIRGDYRRKGETLQPAFPRIVAGNTKPDLRLPNRRASLANWITRSDHPLATRVIVNRIWQYHFGRGLSAATSDFGVMGDEPIHGRLLDWLATEFAGANRSVGRIVNPSVKGESVRDGSNGLTIRSTTKRNSFSLKTLHRLIVTSATYRQASRLNSNAPAAVAAWNKSLKSDPSNQLWSRMPRRRLSGEAIRDAMLAVSRSLSHRRGGPGVRPPLPREITVTLLKNQWPVTKDARDHRRRSVYLFVRRNLRYPIFAVFDKPDTNASCPRRNKSTTAPQSLLLLNSRFSLDTARRLADSIRRSAGDNHQRQIATLYRRTLGRPPTSAEAKLAAGFLKHGDLTQLCLVQFNVNEFVYVD